jgi:hypothetical protein
VNKTHKNKGELFGENDDKKFSAPGEIFSEKADTYTSERIN